MDIYWRRVSEKLVNRIQIQVSLPAFHGGVTEHDLCDVLLPDEVGYRFGDRRSLQFHDLSANCFREANV